jgi:rod shape-determining protein MreC
VLAADYQRLEFLRVLRSHELEPITDPGSLIAPPVVLPRPDTSAARLEAAAGAPPTETEGGDVEAAGSGAAEGADAEATPGAGDG